MHRDNANQLTFIQNFPDLNQARFRFLRTSSVHRLVIVTKHSKILFSYAKLSWIDLHSVTNRLENPGMYSIKFKFHNYIQGIMLSLIGIVEDTVNVR